jgi:hypothetical protein
MCPIQEAIISITSQIKGGATKNNSTVLILKSETPIEYGDAFLTITDIRLRYARFLAGDPSLEKYVKTMIAIPKISCEEYYLSFMTISKSAQLFAKHLENIFKMVETINERVVNNINSTKSINMSLPTMQFNFKISELVLHPTELYTQLTKLINVINKLNINSLLSKPTNKKIDSIAKFDKPQPSGKFDIFADLETINCESAKQALTKWLDFQINMLQYVQSVEQYHQQVNISLCQIYKKINEMVFV